MNNRGLNDKQRKALLEKYRDVNVESYDWHDGYLSDWEHILEERGVRGADLRYSGFWSQGDGASFSGSVRRPDIFLETHFPSETKFLRWAAKQRRVEILLTRDSSCRYSHECSVELDIQLDDFFSIDMLEPLEQELAEVYNKEAAKEVIVVYPLLQDLFRSWMREVYQDLEKTYEYLRSDAVVWEWIEDFLSDEDMRTALAELELTDE